MTRHHLTAAACLSLLAAGVVLAQIPQPLPPSVPVQPPASDPDGVEVLARGPVHEGYAATAEVPTAGEIVAKAPPDPVEELPPDQKPDGDNVQWIPGYWQWDEERTDFIWVSGFWRQPPPGRVWVPGSWRQAPGGHQWVQGFWNATDPQQPQQPAQIEYLPPPPAPLELAPSVPAPSDTCFYTPGVWQWHRNRYAWRPGFWVEHRPNWVWCPAHYRWTPAGYVFVDGFWDHPLARRGILFAPVAFRPAVLVQPRFLYTPAYVVSDTSLYGSMFVRRGYGSYYFGDYFEPRYVKAGYSAWCGVSLRVGNFAVTVGRAAPVYDPLWSYYSVAYRNQPRWSAGVTDLYAGRFNGDFARPPRTLAQQNTVVKNVVNVTNVTNVTGNVMLTKLTDVKPAAQAAALRAVPQADRVREQAAARELRQVAAQRQKLETGLVDRGRTVNRPTDAPQAVTLDLPKSATVRARVPAAQAPPEAPRPAGTRLNPPKTIPPANQPVPPAFPQPVRTKPDPKPGSGRPQPAPVPQPKPPVPQPPMVQPPVPPPTVVSPPSPRPGDGRGRPNRPPTQPNPVVPQPPPLPPPQPKPPVLTPRPLPQPKPPLPVVQPMPPVPAPVTNPPPAPRPRPPLAPTPQPKSPAPVVQPKPRPPAPVVQPPPKPPAPTVTQPQPRPRPQPRGPTAQPPKPVPPPAAVGPKPGPAPKPKGKPKGS